MDTTVTTRSIGALQQSRPGIMRTAFSRIVDGLRSYRGRRALLQLSDDALADIGLRRGDLYEIEQERLPNAGTWQELSRRRRGISE
jgi:uncharacterized protein YjiS (DUF1127 family)